MRDAVGHGTRALAVATCVIALAACSGSPTTTHSGPSPTPSLSASPSDPPSVSPTPSSTDQRCGYRISSFDLSFQAQHGVPKAALRDVRRGSEIARDAFNVEVPICEPGKVRVQVLNRVKGAVAGQTRVENAPNFQIEIFARGAFARTPPSFRPVVLIHEWYHVLEFAFIDCGKECLPLVHRVPDWLIEGAAVEESLSAAADRHIGFYSFFRIGQIAQADRVKRDLEDLSSIRLPEYGLAFAAVELLVARHGHDALEAFWERTGATGDWERAFRRVFGEGVERYYREFDAYRSNGFRRS